MDSPPACPGLMSFSQYCSSVTDSSVTFNNATIKLGARLDGVREDKQGSLDVERCPSEGELIKDLVFKADGGEMVLVLGKPTSSLFQALFEDHKRLAYSPPGTIRFKNNDYKEFATKCPNSIIYSGEDDVHFPTLTVKQTIDFALDCKFDLSVAERNNLRDTLLEELNLSKVANTLVGNEYIRGISGGERKRITILETFIANGSFYMWDNSTKGLDSSTALDFLTTLQKMANTTKSVNFVKVSQASDKIVEKFDKILMLSDSYQIFYGTLDECLVYFRDTLRIPKDPNLCIIEYLTSILDFQSKSTTASADHNSGIRGPIASTEQDFRQAWVASPFYHHWKLITAKMCAQNINEINVQDLASVSKARVVKQIGCCTKRAFRRLLGDKGFIVAQLITCIVEALVTGSLFYNIPLTTIGSFSRGSLTFFAILFFTFLALADLPLIFERQRVVDKQAKLHFYSRWIEALGTLVNDCEFKFIIVLLFTIVLYFLAHFQFNAARFFIFLLFLSILNFSMVSLFSLIAYVTPTVAVANSVAGVLLLAIAMYASYVIYIASMHPWFIWIAYINPAMYAMEAILSNELFNVKLDCTETIVPRGPTYDNVSFTHKTCAWQGATLGRSFVYGKDYLKQALGYNYDHVWRNFGILMGFLSFLLFCCVVGAEYVKPWFTDKEAAHLFSSCKLWHNKNKSMPQDEQQEEIIPMDFVERGNSSGSSTEYIHYDNIDTQKLAKNKVATHEGQQKNRIFAWSNVNYTVGEKTLIENNSGFVASGMTALMGESGAGKTTLLNIISRMTKTGVVRGDFRIDGVPLTNEKSFSKSIGFVQQQDVHMNLLTIRESLEISCVLRGDGDRDYIRTISELLEFKLDKLVRDLNPTEKKLLSIGVELVTKPDLLLLLDEPTSGLDSQAALTIVKFLKKLSLRGQAILCTIHQPSKSVFGYFDNVILLQRGGKCVYFGPSKEACNYFLEHDKNLKYNNESDNPAEFLIDAVGYSRTKRDQIVPDESSDIDWPQIWTTSAEKKASQKSCSIMEQRSHQSSTALGDLQRGERSYIKQLLVITKRQYLCLRRDKGYLVSKFLLNAVAGLFIGFSFWKTKTNIVGLKNAIFLCFMSLCISSPLINQVQDKATESKNVYLAREISSNTYHWSVFLLAQLIVEVPLAIVSSTVFFLCCYFCCGFNFASHIAGVFYLNYILFSVYYLTFGLWLVYSTPNLQTAAVVVAFLYSFTAEFCGVMQPYSLLPGFWKFMYRVSPYTYFVETFVSLLLHERQVNCDPMELVPTLPVVGQTCGEFMQDFVNENGGSVLNPNSTSICAYCTFSIGDEFLKSEFMSYEHIWRNFGIQWAFVVFNVVAMFVGFYLIYVKGEWLTHLYRTTEAIVTRRSSKTLCSS